MTSDELKSRLPLSAFAFRGYNVTNLGRSNELLNHARYGSIVEEYLVQASAVCAEIMNRKTDLVERVRRKHETTLRTYADAIALVVAMEMAQLRILDDCFGIKFKSAKMAFGYSLGEIAALIAAGTLDMAEALKIPLSLARDCVKLANDVTLGVLFSRGPVLSLDSLKRECLLINNEGRGVIGISTILSPNSVLMLGQGDTLDRFKDRIDKVSPDRLYLRKNEHHWPPLHTPIAWEKNIPNRAAVLMHTMKGGFTAPEIPVFSLVTGKFSYNDMNAREILHHWTDHPQRLWEAVYETLLQGVQTVIHVGPQPNIIPATFTRLRDNVEAQTRGSIRMRALSVAVSRPWLKALLPERAALLRSLNLKQLNLEDWLLENEPTAGR